MVKVSKRSGVFAPDTWGYLRAVQCIAVILYCDIADSAEVYDRRRQLQEDLVRRIHQYSEAHFTFILRLYIQIL